MAGLVARARSHLSEQVHHRRPVGFLPHPRFLVLGDVGERRDGRLPDLVQPDDDRFEMLEEPAAALDDERKRIRARCAAFAQLRDEMDERAHPVHLRPALPLGPLGRPAHCAEESQHRGRFGVGGFEMAFVELVALQQRPNSGQIR
jgi:hypothetical protein